jgi:hypothetical protein
MPANTPRIGAAVPGGLSPYRLLVRAVDGPKRKGYMWEIFPMDYGRPSIERSSTRFKSMAEAYDVGAVALGRLNSRMTKRREVLIVVPAVPGKVPSTAENLHATRMRPTMRENGRGPPAQARQIKQGAFCWQTEVRR